MTCPNCGMEWLKPERLEHGPQPVRWYHCPQCGYRWETVELVRATAQRQAFQATLFRVLNGGGTSEHRAPEADCREPAEREERQ